MIIDHKGSVRIYMRLEFPEVCTLKYYLLSYYILNSVYKEHMYHLSLGLSYNYHLEWHRPTHFPNKS